MAEDWLTDVRKYAADADEDVVSSIVKHCGIALRNRDSSLVSFSDDAEVARVRDKFLRKKLALTDPDSTLDDGIAWVKNLMIGDRTKNRVTAYYLLSHYFGKLDLFGGEAGTSPASLAGGVPSATGPAALAGLGSFAAAGAAVPRSPVGWADSSLPTSDRRSQTNDSEIGVNTGPAPDAPGTGSPPSAFAAPMGNQPTYAAGLDQPEEPLGWPRWLTWLLIALAILALFLLMRGCAGQNDAGPTLPVDANRYAGGGQAGGTTSAAAVPAGAGVVSGSRDNMPLLTVYFDSGKAAVSNDLATASTNLKTYLDANPGARLAVSGYNDPSGNAAANAELSKTRAQAVAAALAEAGISPSLIDLVKPDETTSASITPEQARRVEVSVR